MEIAPFRGLRYALQEIGETAENVTAPPYDVISPEEHRRLLDRSPYNLTRLTLGVDPGSASSYDERGERLREWVSAGALRAEEEPALYVNAVDYASPASGRRSRLLGLVALGRLSPFEERIVLAHERTFPRVVDDRERLLRATRANLESILLLYSDPEGAVDRLLEEAARAEPLIRVEAKPGEHHALHAIRDARGVARLVELFRAQRPIIADGHHRYTTSLRFAEAHGEARSGGSSLPGADWRLMTFANLHSSGVSILATHRLVKLAEPAIDAALAALRERLLPASEADWEIRVETVGDAWNLRFPADVVTCRSGVARTSYALLDELLLGDWLVPWVGPEPRVSFFKEGTGERQALERGEGDLLFRMRPVDREEFQHVVEGGEVFPHKTTYFYPKLRSGLVLWSLARVSHQTP